MEIEFKIATKDGIKTCRGELVESNGFQYAIHVFDGEYGVTELSTGMCVVCIWEGTKNVNNLNAKDYLLSEIDKRIITSSILYKAKQALANHALDYPLNDRF